ncbi:unnamed protein product [Gongylonema pulchrum]|uniref:PH domain-containing protein n=1 Tax=Gongylonema pulchrum TaxID=637853 RepID=A0A183DV66_9BILA|nr:unnamed protein product [Gongylonema pulchrum]
MLLVAGAPMISIAPLDRVQRCTGEWSFSVHPEIEARVSRAVQDAVSEWRRRRRDARSATALESNSACARTLINAFDSFLSYGFKEGNRLYWLYVREFMSRSGVDYLKREWRASTARQLSSFQHNPALIRKFYQKEALMANRALLARIVQQLVQLVDVQFRFLKPFESHNGVPLAVVRPTLIDLGPPMANNRLAASSAAVGLSQDEEERRHASNCYSERAAHSLDHSTVALLNVPIAPDFSPPDNEKTNERSGELDGSGRASYKEGNTATDANGNASITETAVSAPMDPFDIALKTSMSKVKLSAENDEKQQNHHERRASPQPTLTDIPFGEVRLNMGEIIALSINVFKYDAERFMRLFQVGPDFQVLYFRAKKDYNVRAVGSGKFSSTLEICTACMQLGAAILDVIKYTYENCISSLHPEKSKLNVHTESTPQHLILRRFMSKELHEDKLTLYGYYLAQWRQTNMYSASVEGCQHSGFLYHKEIRGGIMRLLGSNSFQQSYFLLQNKKLYQFSDSTCKFGERVIPVRDSVMDVVELKDRSAHMFEISLVDGSRIQFICQSAADMHKWVSLITLAITSTDLNDKPAACVVCICERSILVAQEGMNCATDGFMRLLVRIDLASVSQATGVFATDRSACVIKNSGKMDWLLLRSPDEVDRLLAQLDQLGMRKINSEEGGSSRLSAILNSMSPARDIFQFTNSLANDAFETSLDL